MSKPNLPQGFFSMGEVAKQVGVTKNTLFLWERKNKIDKPRRDRNNYRVYTTEDIARIKEFKERLTEPEEVME